MSSGRGRRPLVLALATLLGPLTLWRRSPLGAAALILLVLLLTALTQVGGLLLWLLLPALAAVHRRVRSHGRLVASGATLAIFLLSHLAVSSLLLPWASQWTGRRPLPCLASTELPLRAANPLFCALNRHYAAPQLHALLSGLAAHLAARHPSTVVTYLDAGFPLLDGFPMLPHLSHDDGRQVDLAFFYRDRDSGRPIPAGGAWPLGYWAYSGPRTGEAQPCAGASGRLSLRWDFDWLQPRFAHLRLDAERTAAMLAWLTREGPALGLRKILLEPHLRQRLGVSDDLVRFQGCRAARHDDHLHIDMK